jgi:hypothetical protein
MPNATDHRRNLAPWWALLFAVGAIGCNFVFFARPPLQEQIPWLSVLFIVLAMIFLIAGLWRAFSKKAGKALSIVLSAVTLLVVGLSTLAFVHSRALPSSAAAPQVGQRVPDFTLADISGKPVSLDQLLAASPGAPAPKAVLLIFYRGYW